MQDLEAGKPVFSGVVEEGRMRRGFRSSWILAAGAVFVAMIASGSEARAALSGITISGGFKPGTGDPPYDYIFEVYLAPDTTIYKNEIIKIGTATSGLKDDLVGVTTDSLYHEIPSGHWSSPTIKEVDKTFPYASDVAWKFVGPTYENVTGKVKHIGELEIQTTVNFNSKNPFPVKSGTLLDFTYSLHGVTVQGPPIVLEDLSVQSLAVVPEPSSSAIVLLTGGTAAIAGLIARRRRRRPARTA
jgi:hypothetical protein